MRVAVAQLDAVPLDSAENARRGADAIARAADEGAGLVVLPELFNSGYVLDRERLAPVAEHPDAPGPALRAWQAAAAEGGTAVVAGFCERDNDARLYDSAAAWDSTGRLVGVYRKLHLFGAEREAFAPGDRGLPIFDLDGVSVGVLICYDLRFPEALRVLALRGAEIIGVPAAWVPAFDQRPPAEHESIGQVDAALVQANLSQVFVVAADRVGEDHGTSFLGRSTVASPYGRALLGPLGAAAEAVEVVDIDIEDARRAQERSDSIRPRRDRRDDVYGPMLGYEGGDAAPPRDAEEVLAAYLRERSLDRRTKELVYVAALTALASPREHLIAHLRAALAAGATPAELLEVLEQCLPPCGVPRFMHALDAWQEACGAASMPPVHPEPELERR